MCGRYSLAVSQHPELAELGLQTEDSFNIAPQSEVLLLNELQTPVMMAWDYSPSWAKSPMHLTNARSETLREKPSFRGAKRCVFLADGWYEWQRSDVKRGEAKGEVKKVPWYHHKAGELLYFAGIYNPTSGAAIVTRSAHENIAHIHHRQPVLLESRAVAHWLAGHDLFASAITRSVCCHPVSQAVNNPSENAFALTEAVELPAAAEPVTTQDLFGDG